MIMATVIGTMVIGVCGIIGVVLHHLMTRKDEQVKMERLQKVVFPELETMTYKMLGKSMDVLSDKFVEINKKMSTIQYDDYEIVKTEEKEENQEKTDIKWFETDEDLEELLPF